MQPNEQNLPQSSDLPETQSVPKPKLHWLLKLAIISSVISLFCSITSMALFEHLILKNFTIPTLLFFVALFTGAISVPLYLAAVIFAAGRRFFAFGLAVASFFLLFAFGFSALGAVKINSYSIMCQSNLTAIKKAVLLYSKIHDNLLPDPNWCDKLLKTDTRLSQRELVCRASDARRGQSSYALNKNLIGRKLSDANPDTVMIFETNSGWNQIGSSELISPNNHGGDGCNVLFVNGKIRFIPEDKIPTLRWNP